MEVIDSILLAVIIALVLYILIVANTNGASASQQNMYPLGYATGTTAPLDTHDKKLSSYTNGLIVGAHQYDSGNDQDSLLHDMSNKQSTDYKNKYFEFRDHVNGNSDNMLVDPVDKINSAVYSDFKNCDTQKISEIYNKLVNIDNGTIASKGQSNLDKSALSGNILSGGNGNIYDGYYWVNNSNNAKSLSHDVSSSPYMAV